MKKIQSGKDLIDWYSDNILFFILNQFDKIKNKNLRFILIIPTMVIFLITIIIGAFPYYVIVIFGFMYDIAYKQL